MHHAADLHSGLRAIAYLSSVGVYGDYGGAWVDERTIPHPKHERAVRRLKAERAWRAKAEALRVPLAIYRIAGIYGPGRNALANLAEGKAHRVVKPGQVFNRIHVDDIAATLRAGLDRNATGMFNLADDGPSAPDAPILYAAELMGVPPPPAVPFAEAELSPMARSFYEGNRRVMNERIKRDLGVSLRYPTYREGLDALWRDGTWRG
jgi:nucleoside-diphosphate-sugar epimerase